jgi:quinoprotein glucose dehydrogenase
MSRKYVAIVCSAAVFIVASYFLYHLFRENKEYLKLQLSESRGSFLLDMYRSLKGKKKSIIPAVSSTIATNQIPYSIFDRNLSLKENANERSALPEFKVIPGLSDDFKGKTYPSSFAFDTWHRGHGDNSSSKYSRLDQINRQNVQNLSVAWIYHAGGEWDSTVETNPVIAGGKVFTTTPDGYLVALDAVSGVEKWRNKFIHNVPARRGLLWWPGNAKYGPRLFVPSFDGVYAVNPDDGRIIQDFGITGRVGQPSVVPPVVDKDRLIVATSAPSVEAFNVESGALLWKTELLKSSTSTAKQLPFGKYRISGAVPWGGISLDENRHRVYVTTGNPRPNLYGVSRPGRNEYSCSVLSINTLTGKIEWSFQEVAHDLWDLDIPSPPNLLTIKKAGRPIDVVATVTKIGNVLLLERDTGKPVFDFRFRRAPVSEVPGETTWPYQPDVETPKPYAKKTFEPSDITNLSAAQTESVAKKIKNAKFGFFPPPVINGKVAIFNVHGGAEWPGAAADPETGILYIPSNQIPWLLHLYYSDSAPNPIRSSDKKGDELYQKKCGSCHGVDREGNYEREFTGDRVEPSLVGISASRDVGSIKLFWENHDGLVEHGSITDEEIKAVAAYLRAADHISDDRRSLTVTHAWQLLLDNKGYPGSKPPWGLITAVDLNSGKYVWQIPFGEYPELTKRGIPVTGQHNFGGVMVTKGGLVFATGTIDKKIRAYDSATGKQLWDYDLPATGSAPPSTYEIGNTQYIVVVATGGWYAGFKGHSDTVIAFKLKEPSAKAK